MRNGMITVVLPIYNVEKYLERCLKSVVNQTYENLEIILVDDGSSDRCPVICEEWAKKDDRIRVIHKKNAGLGMARNTGIENAKGEYICFFDSDDYIALDTIEKAYQLAKKEKADVVTFGFCNVKKDGRTGATVIPQTQKNIFCGWEVQNIFLPDLIGPDVANGCRTNLWMSACMAIFSMNLIKRANWKFVSEREIISEDIYSLLKLYRFVNRVAVLSEALYFYCENESSLTHIYRTDRYKKIKHFYDECQVACKDSGYSEKVTERLSYPYLSNTIGAMKMIVSTDCNKGEKKKNLREIIDDAHLQTILKEVNIRNEAKTRKLLLVLMRLKAYSICYILLNLKR